MHSCLHAGFLRFSFLPHVAVSPRHVHLEPTDVALGGNRVVAADVTKLRGRDTGLEWAPNPMAQCLCKEREKAIWRHGHMGQTVL